MQKDLNPLLSDDFLEEVRKEINQSYGGFPVLKEEDPQLEAE
jgi:hypothetical protein